jgi:hypothetical protein
MGRVGIAVPTKYDSLTSSFLMSVCGTVSSSIVCSPRVKDKATPVRGQNSKKVVIDPRVSLSCCELSLIQIKTTVSKEIV